MGVEKCDIIYDNSTATFYAGQTVSGKIELTFNSPKKFRAIRAVFLGEANVSWRQKSGKHTRHYKDNRKYYKLTKDLCTSEDGEQKELSPGKYVYPFTFLLPPNIPSSFEGSHGSIRYSIKVVIDRPWRFDHEYKFLLTVLSEYDLNKYPQLSRPAHDELTKKFGCFCCVSGPCEIKASLPHSGYVSGQTIPIKIEGYNHSSKDIFYIQYELEKEIVYTVGDTWKRSKTEKKTIAGAVTNFGFIPGSQMDLDLKLTIPAVPPSQLVNCDIIMISYRVKIKAKVTGCSTSPRLVLPIEIGTIPINEPTRTEQPSSLPQSYGNLHELPPPTYEEYMFQAQQLHGEDDNEFTNMQTANFAPRYPCYTFPTAPPLYDSAKI